MRSCRRTAAGPLRALRSMTLCFKRIFSRLGSDAVQVDEEVGVRVFEDYAGGSRVKRICFHCLVDVFYKYTIIRLAVGFIEDRRTFMREGVTNK